MAVLAGVSGCRPREIGARLLMANEPAVCDRCGNGPPPAIFAAAGTGVGVDLGSAAIRGGKRVEWLRQARAIPAWTELLQSGSRAGRGLWRLAETRP